MSGWLIKVTIWQGQQLHYLWQSSNTLQSKNSILMDFFLLYIKAPLHYVAFGKIYSIKRN